MKITAAHLPNLGYQEWDTGHGKLSAELDLRMPGDVDILRGLVRKADVFSQGYRPGTLVSRGLSPEAWRRGMAEMVEYPPLADAARRLSRGSRA